MIKTVLQTALFSACVFCSQNIFAWTISFDNEPTKCWIFKSNKLVHKADCSYSGYGYGDTSGENYHREGYVVIKNYGKMDFLISDGYFLNDKKATTHYRDTTSLKRITEKEIERRYAKKWQHSPQGLRVLDCYKGIKTGLELCLIDEMK